MVIEVSRTFKVPEQLLARETWSRL